MKRSLPIAAAIASAAALTVPALAGATTYCVSKPACVMAGGTDAPGLGAALAAAKTSSPGPDRIELGPGDFTAGAGGFIYSGVSGEAVDIAGSGQGVTRLLNSSASGNEKTLQLLGTSDSSASDLTVVAPTPAGSPTVVWAAITTGTLRRVSVEGAHDFIAVQLFTGAKIEDSTIHGDAKHTAVTALDGTSVSGSTIVSDGPSIATVGGGTLDISRTRIDAHAGPTVSGTATLNISDSLIRTHGGPGLFTSSGSNTNLHATGDTIVGDGVGSAALIAGEGTAGHSTHATISNSILANYGFSVLANQAGGAVDVKVSHSDYDAPVSASAGQVDETDANIHDAPAFVDPATGDFHLGAGSPLIDAGDPAVASQADLDGSQRSTDGNGDGTAVPDIGAFERPAPAPPAPPDTPPTDPQTPGGDTPPPPPANPEDAAPSLTGFRVARRHVVRGHRTSFRFKVSEASRVTITLRRHGHVVRTLRRRAHSGRNRVAWRATLKRGRYVATARATDSAGQRSASRRVRFTLSRPRAR